MSWSDYENDVYYRIYYYEPDDNVTVICMQDFDEKCYNQEHFFKDENNEILKFYTEYEAVNWLNDNVVDNKIDSVYRQRKFNQKKYLKSN